MALKTVFLYRIDKEALPVAKRMEKAGVLSSAPTIQNWENYAKLSGYRDLNQFLEAVPDECFAGYLRLMKQVNIGVAKENLFYQSRLPKFIRLG